MLSERPRNIIVGLTMVVALCVLAYGIVLLGKSPRMYGTIGPYKVTITATNANGLTAGSRVEINGVLAGQVESVWLDNQGLVNSNLQIDDSYSIPSDAQAILSKPQLGSPVVTIDTTLAKGPPIPKNGTGKLKAVAGDSGLIPRQIFDDVHDLKEQIATLATKLTIVADDLHLMLVYAPPEAVNAADPNDPKRLRENVSTVIIKLNRTMDSVQALLSAENIAAVKDIVKNVSEASAKIKGTLEQLDKIIVHADTAVDSVKTAADAVTGAATQASITFDSTQKEIVRLSQNLADMLDQVQKSTKAITEGPGTTGRLVSDPRLYEGLLDLSTSLKKAADDLDFLMRKWKDEGVDLRLK